MVPRKSTAEKVSFEWSHHRISSTDPKVRTIPRISVIDFEIERVDVSDACVGLSTVLGSFYKLHSRCFCRRRFSISSTFLISVGSRPYMMLML